MITPEYEGHTAGLAGLPVLRCPRCGEVGKHWEPDALDPNGLIVPGRFICETPATSVATEMRLL